MRGICAIDPDYCAGHGVTLKSGGGVFGAALVIFGEEMEGIAGDGALEFVAFKVAGEFVCLVSEFQGDVERSAQVIGGADPAAGERASDLRLRFLGVLWLSARGGKKSR